MPNHLSLTLRIFSKNELDNAPVINVTAIRALPELTPVTLTDTEILNLIKLACSNCREQAVAVILSKCNDDYLVTQIRDMPDTKAKKWYQFWK